MSRLATLRARLQSLRSARAAVRWGNALSLMIFALLAGWLAAYALDWSLQLNRWFRAAVLVGWGTGVAAAIHRWTWPLVRVEESLEEIALVVEREHAIDSDLVAALQFDGPHAPAWGSARLSSAVVDYVAEFSQSLDVFRGFTWNGLPRRMALAVAALVTGSALFVIAPAHASAFWNRFWLGAARYPTETQIVELTINGVSVPVHRPRTERFAIPQEDALQMVARVAGVTPLRVFGLAQGLSTRERAEWPFVARAAGEFVHESPQVVESARLFVVAGDAESDPIEINVVPLPVVDVTWSALPPQYARGGPVGSVAPGARQFAALQGSQLELVATAINKPLKIVELKLGSTTIPLVADPAKRDMVWKLPEDAPVRELREPLHYELNIVDIDGLRPRPGITGDIRLQTDRLPRVAAAVVSRRVLPTAAPKISYGATDDFGIREVRWQVEVVKADGARQNESRRVFTAGEGSPERTVKRESTLDLTHYGLEKGDEVRVTVVADDYRGEFPSNTGYSEPLIFDVTDRNGILESLLEIDQQSAKQLDEIIERELGIGRTSR